MDVVILPQLKNLGASAFGAPVRYRIAAKEHSAAVQLDDRAVNKLDLATSGAVRLVFPARQSGYVRDFFVRLVITSDDVPEITFAPPTGEIISFEDVDESILSCEIGINVFSFTENDEGVFFVNRKTMDIDHDVELDACGGTGIVSPVTFKLGGKFTALPTPVRNGYVFQGWFTEATGGTLISSDATVKTGITKLYAQWEVYVDPYVDAICPAKNLTFFSSGNAQWFVDNDTYASEPGSARSGYIGDNQSSSLTTTVSGPGRIEFKCKVSSEGWYDKVQFIVDGNVIVEDFSGEQGWTDFWYDVTGEGTHTIECRYSKDGSCSSGSDCCWIDDIVWTPAEA